MPARKVLPNGSVPDADAMEATRSPEPGTPEYARIVPPMSRTELTVPPVMTDAEMDAPVIVPPMTSAAVTVPRKTPLLNWAEPSLRICHPAVPEAKLGD